MAKFNAKQKTDPIAAIKTAAVHLQSLIAKAEQELSGETKAQLAENAVQDYNITMRSLTTIYKSQPKVSEIEQQLSVYRGLGDKAKELKNQHPTQAREKELKDINEASGKRIKHAVLAASSQATNAAVQKETSSSAEAASTPAEAVSTPVEAVSTPVEAVSTPVEAVSTPVEAVSTPVEAVSTPVEAVSTAVVPASPPEEGTEPIDLYGKEPEAPYRQPRQVVMDKVNEIYAELEENIKSIDKHHTPKAAEVATQLFADLDKARRDYFLDIYYSTREDTAHSRFIKKCTIAIEKARPTLENDLGWGDYLQNLLKSLANIITTIATLGGYDGFFTPKKSAAIVTAEHAKDQLLNDEEVQLKQDLHRK